MKTIVPIIQKKGFSLRCVYTDQLHHRYALYEGHLQPGIKTPDQKKEQIRSVLFVLQGSALAQIGDFNFIELGPFSVLNIKPGEKFSLENRGDTNFSFLCFYAPQVSSKKSDHRSKFNNHLSVVRADKPTPSTTNGVKVFLKEQQQNGFLISCNFAANYQSPRVGYIGFEEIWYVVKGQIEIWVEENESVKKRLLSHNDSLHIHAGDVIQFRNVSNEALEILVMQIPLEEEVRTVILENGPMS